jgi:hypothetical protein
VSDDDRSAELRVRAALAAGSPAAPADVQRVLDDLAAQRALAAERWVAIGALAPRAKSLRGRVLALERAVAAAGAHLAAGAVGEAGDVLRRALTL